MYRVLLFAFFATTACAAQPVLTYSTFLRPNFEVAGIALDQQSSIHIGGTAIVNGQRTVLAVKLDSTGSKYLYETYLSGSVSESAAGIAVDATGATYIVGTTSSPDFPTTTAAAITQPVGFLAKLSLSGSIVYSITIPNTTPRAVAVDAQNEAIVTGDAAAPFMPTAGAFQALVDQSIVKGGSYFVIKLNAAGTQTMFAALGVGGSAIALDPQGNIYVSGSTFATNYPTTPGAFQSKIVPAFMCFFPCQIQLQAPNQYLSKLDPTGAKLLYSTGLNSMGGEPTYNSGLAVDAAGSAYVTGTTLAINYPYSEPLSATSQRGFLTKMKPDGSDIVYSLRQGGSAVQVDPAGTVYVAGPVYEFFFDAPGLPPIPPNPVAGAAAVPAQCYPDGSTTNTQSYAMRLDAATGDVLGAQVFDGSFVQAASLAIAGDNRLWIGGLTGFADVPIAGGAIALPPSPGAGWQDGAWLAQVDFFHSPPTGPQVACVTDSADLQHTGPIAPNQLLSIFGTGLGSATVTFDGEPGNLLYVSPSQINVAVPRDLAGKSSTLMRVSTFSRGSSERVLQIAPSRPALFVNPLPTALNCEMGRFPATASFAAVALNADGSLNSCANPAGPSSVVSIFLEGVGVGPLSPSIDVLIGSRSATVVQVSAAGPYVQKVDIQLPPPISGENFIEVEPVTVRVSGVAAGPFLLGNATGASANVGIFMSPK